MAASLRSKVDHIAVAVPDWESVEPHWREHLGGSRVAWEEHETFRGRQLRFANGGKFEMIAPARGSTDPDNFVRRFIARYGTTVQHITLKVPDFAEALETLQGAGAELVDVHPDGEVWKELFVRPGWVGGLLVQVGWSSYDDVEWALTATGQEPEAPREGAASLLGATLFHPDLDRATQVWQLLGATVERSGDRIWCRWEGSPMDIEVQRGTPAGPRHLRMSGRRELFEGAWVGPSVRLTDAGEVRSGSGHGEGQG